VHTYFGTNKIKDIEHYFPIVVDNLRVEYPDYLTIRESAKLFNQRAVSLFKPMKVFIVQSLNPSYEPTPKVVPPAVVSSFASMNITPAVVSSVPTMTININVEQSPPSTWPHSYFENAPALRDDGDMIETPERLKSNVLVTGSSPPPSQPYTTNIFINAGSAAKVSTSVIPVVSGPVSNPLQVN
jgi:hypothetical protein